MNGLIQDVWKSYDCPTSSEGCEIAFTDEEFETLARDSSYYVRAIQESTPAINGENTLAGSEEFKLCKGNFKDW